MSKEELLKAIENGESVWFVSGKEIEELNKNNIPTFWVMSFDVFQRPIFKTKAEAEHYLYHANITRTETLPFLTWEEFYEQKFIWFVDKKQNQCCFYYLNVSNKIFLNVSGEVIELGDLTEENFYKAYDECVKLFKGCEDE